MNNTENLSKSKRQVVNVFFEDNGISILELLELDFEDFVNKIIKENIR